MKAYIGPYISRWVSKVYDRYMHKKYGYFEWSDSKTRFEKFLEGYEKCLQFVYNYTINLYLDRKKRKIRIKTHEQDHWDAYVTIAHIALPVLRDLKESKAGCPWVDDEDVPEQFHSKNYPKQYEYEWDEGVPARWKFVFEEIIWALEQCVDDDAENQFFTGGVFGGGGPMKCDSDGLKKYNDRIQNGLRLFGKYFRSLWD